MFDRTRSNRQNATRLVLMPRIGWQPCHRADESAKRPDGGRLKTLNTRGHRDELRLQSLRGLGMCDPRNEAIHARFEAAFASTPCIPDLRHFR
jgi:hypothetical protein